MSAQDLWCQVLLVAFTDALNGLPTEASSRQAGTRLDARSYILTPNPDFTLVCHLAGVDPEAVREGLRAQLAGTRGRATQANRSLPAALPQPWHARGRKHAYGGHALTLREWAERTGLPYEVLHTRLNRRSWSIERALTEPLGRRMPKPSRSEPDQVARILDQLAAANPLATGVAEAFAQSGWPAC